MTQVVERWPGGGSGAGPSRIIHPHFCPFPTRQWLDARNCLGVRVVSDSRNCRAHASLVRHTRPYGCDRMPVPRPGIPSGRRTVLAQGDAPRPSGWCEGGAVGTPERPRWSTSRRCERHGIWCLAPCIKLRGSPAQHTGQSKGDCSARRSGPRVSAKGAEQCHKADTGRRMQ